MEARPQEARERQAEEEGEAMTTLITRSTSRGTRRCDGLCHNATGKKCRCVCGGKNHGVGENQAVINTADMAQELLQKGGMRIDPMKLQLSMFREFLA